VLCGFPNQAVQKTASFVYNRTNTLCGFPNWQLQKAASFVFSRTIMFCGQMGSEKTASFIYNHTNMFCGLSKWAVQKSASFFTIAPSCFVDFPNGHCRKLLSMPLTSTWVM
jgi:hypothetical protein